MFTTATSQPHALNRQLVGTSRMHWPPVLALSLALHIWLLNRLDLQPPSDTHAAPLPLLEIGLLPPPPAQQSADFSNPLPEQTRTVEPPVPDAVPARPQLPKKRIAVQKAPHPKPTPRPEEARRTETPPSISPAPAAPSPQAQTSAEPSLVKADHRADYLHNPKPKYPDIAKRRGWEGKVVLKVSVTAEGGCAEAQVQETSGHDILDQSALTAVRTWKFVPARRGDKPVPDVVRIAIKFHVDSDT